MPTKAAGVVAQEDSTKHSLAQEALRQSEERYPRQFWDNVAAMPSDQLPGKFDFSVESFNEQTRYVTQRVPVRLDDLTWGLRAKQRGKCGCLFVECPV